MLKTYTSKATCAKYTWAVVLSICLDRNTCINYARASVLSICPEHPHPFLFCPGLRQTWANPHQREGSDSWIILPDLKTIISQAMSTMKYVSFNYFNFPEHLHIRHPEKIIIIKIWMIYFTISQVPVCLEIPSYTSYIQFTVFLHQT